VVRQKIVNTGCTDLVDQVAVDLNRVVSQSHYREHRPVHSSFLQVPNTRSYTHVRTSTAVIDAKFIIHLQRSVEAHPDAKVMPPKDFDPPLVN
jgi:hypothetical protein